MVCLCCIKAAQKQPLEILPILKLMLEIRSEVKFLNSHLKVSFSFFPKKPEHIIRFSNYFPLLFLRTSPFFCRFISNTFDRLDKLLLQFYFLFKSYLSHASFILETFNLTYLCTHYHLINFGQHAIKQSFNFLFVCCFIHKAELWYKMFEFSFCIHQVIKWEDFPDSPTKRIGQADETLYMGNYRSDYRKAN